MKLFGNRKISSFIENLVKSPLIHHDLEQAYREMALDETRAREAISWYEGVIGVMWRGKVCWVDSNPSLDGEVQKFRPVLMVSNHAANKMTNRVQAAPIDCTSKCYPCEASVEMDGAISKAMMELLAIVSLRLKTKISALM